MRLPGITIICGKAGYFGVVVCMKEMPRLNASSRRISLKWNTSSFLYFYTRVCRKNRVRVGKTYYREYTGEKYKSQGRPAGWQKTFHPLLIIIISATHTWQERFTQWAERAERISDVKFFTLKWCVAIWILLQIFQVRSGVT